MINITNLLSSISLLFVNISPILLQTSPDDIFPNSRSNFYPINQWYTEESPQELYEAAGGTTALYTRPLDFTDTNANMWTAWDLFNMKYDVSADVETGWVKRWNGFTMSINNAWVTDPITNPVNNLSINFSSPEIKTSTWDLNNSLVTRINSSSQYTKNSLVNGSTSTSWYSAMSFNLNAYGYTASDNFYERELFTSQYPTSWYWFGIDSSTTTSNISSMSSFASGLYHRDVNQNVTTRLETLSTTPLFSCLECNIQYETGGNKNYVIGFNTGTLTNPTGWSTIDNPNNTYVYLNPFNDASLTYLDGAKTLYTIAYNYLFSNDIYSAFEAFGVSPTRSVFTRINQRNPNFIPGSVKINPTNSANIFQSYTANSYNDNTGVNHYYKTHYEIKNQLPYIVTQSPNFPTYGASKTMYLNILVDWSILDSSEHLISIQLPKTVGIAGIAQVDWNQTIALLDISSGSYTEQDLTNSYNTGYNLGFNAGAVTNYNFMADLFQGIIGGSLAFILTIGNLQFLGVRLNTLIYLVVGMLIIVIIWRLLRAGVGK